MSYTLATPPIRTFFPAAIRFRNWLLPTRSTTTTTTAAMQSDDIRALCATTRAFVQPLDGSRHKGQAGRIGIVGGSFEYTGAPFFAAMAALRTGMDLAHVFCARDAAAAIKAYSPELIVHPVLGTGPAADAAADDSAVSAIRPWLQRLDVLLIGPGLGRDPLVWTSVARLIDVCRAAGKPLVIDADGLSLVAGQPQLIRDYPGGCVLTPNAPELERLLGDGPATYAERDWPAVLQRRFGSGITVLQKGRIDRVWLSSADGKGPPSVDCLPGGSLRRCGGQGDVLSGAVAALLRWSLQNSQQMRETTGQHLAEVRACQAASFLTRQCSERAFQRHGRGMLTTDMLTEVAGVFAEHFERVEDDGR